MDFLTFKNKYLDFPTDKLLSILTKEQHKYTPDAIKAAKEVLSMRGVAIAPILEEYRLQQEREALQPESVIIENKSIMGQMEYLTTKRLDVENNIDQIIEENYKIATNDELVMELESISQIILRNNQFGQKTELHSIENYKHLIDLIARKNVLIDQTLKRKIKAINELLTKKANIKLIPKIFIGIILLIAGLALTFGTQSGRIYYGAIITGGVIIVKSLIDLSDFIFWKKNCEKNLNL